MELTQVMAENGFRKVGIPAIIIVLAVLMSLLVTMNEKWILVVPILAIGLLVILRPFWGLLLFAVLIPLESSFLSLGGGAASVTRFLGVFVFGVWIIHLLSRRQRMLIPSSLRIGILFILWGSISVLWAFSQNATLARIQTAVQLLMLTILVVNLTNDLKKLKALLGALFIGSIIVTFLGVIGIGVETGGYLLTLENQGAKEYGSYVGIVFLIGSILFVFEKKYYRWLGLAAIAFAAVPLIQVNQRGIFLAIALAWIVISVLTRQNAKAILFIAMMFLVMNLLPPFLEQQGMISSYNAERLTIQNIVETGGTGRSDIWGVGFRMFSNNPITGTGWGNYSIVHNRYASPAEVIYSYFSTSGKDAHSDLFGVAGELGIIGVILFLIMYGSILIRDVSALRYLPSASKLYLIIVIALMVYIFSTGLTSTFLWRKLYWLILGMGILAPKILIINKPKKVLQEISTAPQN